MTTQTTLLQEPESTTVDSTLQQTINQMIDDMISRLSDPKKLPSTERRGIIARYSSVLEGNFIYWMTATVIATKAEAARSILFENLYEETRDAHPHMMRKFAMAANAFPTDKDALAVHEEVTNMRLFLGRLVAVQSLLSMAFFEGYIQKYMAFLAALAAEESSTEMEYTDVHGVCDIEHTAGLFRALAIEQAVNPLGSDMDIFEGVTLLCAVLDRINAIEQN
jgi:hypothetical protein